MGLSSISRNTLTKRVCLQLARNLSAKTEIEQVQAYDVPPSVSQIWSTLVADAEKVIGFPTSSLRLQWLQSEEFAKVRVHLKKMAGSEHPFLKTVKKFLFENDTPPWSLIILLISNARGLNTNFSEADKDKSAGVLHSQKVLAEVTEMLQASNKMHNTIHTVKKNNENFEDMHFGNKMALLSGDFLLSRSFQNLANLRNQEINELMSTALRDLAENEFLGLRDSRNKPLPLKRKPKSLLYKEKPKSLLYKEKPESLPSKEQSGKMLTKDQFNMEPFDHTEVLGNTKAEWTLRSMLGGGSLLSRACQCTLKLANHSEDIQRNGYLIGKHLALAWQAHTELKPFEDIAEGPYNLVSAPVLFHLDYDPSAYSKIECGLRSVDDVDYEGLRCAIIEGPALGETLALQKEHANCAVDLVEKLPQSEARNALCNFVMNLT